MTSALKPPGGIYWRAALFAPFTVSMPIHVGMKANPWPNVDLDINMPIQLGMSAPSGFGINMSLLVGMFGKPSGTAAFNILLQLQVGMSTYTPFAITLSLQVGMQVKAVVAGRQLNTTVHRSSTI